MGALQANRPDQPLSGRPGFGLSRTRSYRDLTGLSGLVDGFLIEAWRSKITPQSRIIGVAHELHLTLTSVSIREANFGRSGSTCSKQPW